MHLNRSNGYWYLRKNTKTGKETIEKLGKHPQKPTIYKPQLFNDKAENITSRIPDESIDCIVTDPPYGIDLDVDPTGNHLSMDTGMTTNSVANDTTTEFLDELSDEFYRILKPDSHLYIFTRWDAFTEMSSYFKNKFEFNTTIVWDKNNHGVGDLSTWAPRHEFIMHFEKGNPTLNGKRPQNLLTYSGFNTGKNREYQIHPTQKPRKLLEFLIGKSTQIEDVVFDPFGGSYATPRAAMRKFRKSIGCELDPEIHRQALSLIERQLNEDPEYGCSWKEINNLEIKQTDVVQLRDFKVSEPPKTKS